MFAQWRWPLKRLHLPSSDKRKKNSQWSNRTIQFKYVLIQYSQLTQKRHGTNKASNAFNKFLLIFVSNFISTRSSFPTSNHSCCPSCSAPLPRRPRPVQPLSIVRSYAHGRTSEPRPARPRWRRWCCSARIPICAFRHTYVTIDS